MSLLAEVLQFLERERVPHALIGVAGLVGLVLLKLHAGGPKDAWDIRALFEVSDDPAAVQAGVERAIHRLPADARLLWSRLRAEAPA